MGGSKKTKTPLRNIKKIVPWESNFYHDTFWKLRSLNHFILSAHSNLINKIFGWIKLLNKNLHFIECAPLFICSTSVVILTSSCYTHSSVVGVVSSLKTFLKPASFRHLPDKNSGRFYGSSFSTVAGTLWKVTWTLFKKQRSQVNLILWVKKSPKTR